MIVNTGLERIANLMGDDMTHQAIGTGTTAPIPADTTMQTETDRNPTSKTTIFENQVEIRTLFLNSELPTQIEEVGLFNAASAGIMHSRALLQYAKAPSRDLLIVWKFTLQDG